MFDVEAFVAVLEQENTEVLVNGERGRVEISPSSISVVDSEGELVIGLNSKELEQIEVDADGMTLHIGFGNTLIVREVSPVYF